MRRFDAVGREIPGDGIFDDIKVDSCPFCGNFDTSIVPTDDGCDWYIVSCNKRYISDPGCGAIGPDATSPALAAKLWGDTSKGNGEQ